MSQRYIWRLYCVTEDEYVTILSDTQPSTCPNNIIHTIDNGLTSIMQSQYIDIISPGYVNVQSSLADNQALKINASNASGGIDMDAGIGGITIDSKNSIGITATTASNFTVTGSGNLTLEAKSGTTDIDGKSGLNIGNASTTTPILLGSSANIKSITIGNLTSSTITNIRSGTGGINLDTGSGGAISLDATGASSNFTLTTTGAGQDLNIAVLGSTNSSIILTSQGTGSDAIKLDTVGGIAISATNGLNITTSSNTGGAITLDTTSNSGGINISAGNLGVGINSTFGVVGICNTAGAQIVLGNTSTTNFIFHRFAAGNILKQQVAEVNLGGSSATATIANLLNGIITMAGTLLGINMTMPTATLSVAGILNVQVNDSFDFTLINSGTLGNVTVIVGTGGTNLGSLVVGASSVASFRVRFTNVGGGTEAYRVYRIT